MKKIRPYRQMMPVACAALFAALSLPLAAAEVDPLSTLLPRDAQVQEVLGALPAVRAADSGIAAAQARSRALQAGPYEWVLKAGTQRRSDTAGERTSDRDLGIETALRSLGKRSADAQLGETGMMQSRLARSDAWHEAARGMLADWFETLRDLRSADLLQRQAQLAAQQLETVRQRVRSGETAKLDLLAVQAELARAQAAALQARSRSALLLRALAQRYPGLAAPPANALPLPPEVEGSAQDWVERILADNHELELAQSSAQLAQQAADRVALDRRPDPLVGVRSARERSGQERIWGVYVSVPLGPTLREANAAAAAAEADRAAQMLAQTRRKVELEAWRVATLALEQLTTWKQLDAARLDTERSAALQARAYELGEATLTEVQQARRLALEAALTAENARVDALQAQARLRLDSHQIWTPGDSAH